MKKNEKKKKITFKRNFSVAIFVHFLVAFLFGFVPFLPVLLEALLQLIHGEETISIEVQVAECSHQFGVHDVVGGLLLYQEMRASEIVLSHF